MRASVRTSSSPQHTRTHRSAAYPELEYRLVNISETFYASLPIFHQPLPLPNPNATPLPLAQLSHRLLSYERLRRLSHLAGYQLMALKKNSMQPPYKKNAECTHIGWVGERKKYGWVGKMPCVAFATSLLCHQFRWCRDSQPDREQ